MSTLTAQERSELRKALIVAKASLKGCRDDAALLERAKQHGIKTPAPQAPQAPQAPTPAQEAQEAQEPLLPMLPPLAPLPVAQDTDNIATAIQHAIIAALGQVPAPVPAIDEEAIKALIAKHGTVTTTHHIEHKEKPTIKIEGAHSAFTDVLNRTKSYPITGVVPYLWGKAGSGKTTLAFHVAEALDLPFYSYGALFDKCDILGYKDVNGDYQPTDAYRAFTQGGVVLFDELDGCLDEVLVSLNQLFNNDRFGFPCGMEKKHKDFYVIAGGNTNGLGGTASHQNRTCFDKAVLDRLTLIHIEYDHNVENNATHSAAKAINPNYDPTLTDKLIAYVRTARDHLDALNSDLVMSPRKSIAGAVDLAQGYTLEQTINTHVHALMTTDQINQLKAKAA